MESKTIKINNTDLPVKGYKGQRVVTFKEIDAVHKRPAGTAGRNFNTNKRHLIEGVDYFQLTYEEARGCKKSPNKTATLAVKKEPALLFCDMIRQS